MKRFFAMLMVLVCLCCFSGCKDVTASSELPTMYTQLSGFKGIELYVWEGEDGYRCGFLEGTNRNKTEDDYAVLYENPVTLQEAAEILKGYPKEMYVFVIPLTEATAPMVQALHETLDSLQMPNLSTPEIPVA